MSHNLLSKTGLQYFWGKLKAFFVKGNAKVFYGTCDTAGATAAKVVTCSAFTSADLENGTMLIVKFANANSAAAANVTLNVNSTGAMDVKMVSEGNAGTLPTAGQIRPTSTAFIFNKSSDGVTKYWLLISSDTDTTYATITTTELNTGTGTGKRVVSASVLRSNFYTESEVDTLIASAGNIPVATTQPSGGMLPNVLYKLGTLSGSVTLSLASPTDSTIENEYHFTFDTGSTAPTITWPSNLTWSGGSAPTVNASKHYEVSIEDGYAYATEF